MPRERNVLILIKKVTNINSLMKRKTRSFAIVVSVFVLILLIVPQALLDLLDSKELELPSILESIFL